MHTKGVGAGKQVISYYLWMSSMQVRYVLLKEKLDVTTKANLTWLC